MRTFKQVLVQNGTSTISKKLIHPHIFIASKFSLCLKPAIGHTTLSGIIVHILDAVLGTYDLSHSRNETDPSPKVIPHLPQAITNLPRRNLYFGPKEDTRCPNPELQGLQAYRNQRVKGILMILFIIRREVRFGQLRTKIS